LQRIGRTLRRGDGSKKPLIIIMYVKGTGDSNVAISQGDTNFKDAATVFTAAPNDAISMIDQILQGKAPKRSSTTHVGQHNPSRAVKVSKPGIDESAYRWTEIASPGAGRSRFETVLRQLKRKTAIKAECQRGKTIAGEFGIVIGDDVFLTSPDQSVPIAAIHRMWTGELGGGG
jgi:hypothetical protein